MKKVVLILSMVAVLGVSSAQLIAGQIPLHCREQHDACIASTPMYLWGDCIEDYQACVYGWNGL